LRGGGDGEGQKSKNNSKMFHGFLSQGLMSAHWILTQAPERASLS
jgi:hypothetical protein